MQYLFNGVVYHNEHELLEVLCNMNEIIISPAITTYSDCEGKYIGSDEEDSEEDIVDKIINAGNIEIERR